MTTPKEKLSITLAPDVAARAKAAGGKNFSAYVEQALEEKLLNDGMLEYARLRARDAAEDAFEAAEADIEAAA